MDINDRLELVMKEQGLNMNAFAKAAGLNYITLYNTISKSGRRSDPHASTLASIKQAFPEIDMNWLLTGEGEMLLQPPADVNQVLIDVVKELRALREDVDELKKG